MNNYMFKLHALRKLLIKIAGFLSGYFKIFSTL